MKEKGKPIDKLLGSDVAIVEEVKEVARSRRIHLIRQQLECLLLAYGT